MSGDKKKQKKTPTRKPRKDAKKEVLRRSAKNDTLDSTDDSQERPPQEYWNRISDDAASGYGAEEDSKKHGPDSILNEDQEPGDEERGDA